MATPDHTVVARPSVPSDGYPSNPLGRPFYLADTAGHPQQRRAAQLGGIAMAINAITCLLANSEAFRDAQANSVSVEPGHWPLTATCTEGLFAGVFFLAQYAESLSLELDG
ncbi:hypothetical protein [Dyella koreensis]|uniref:Uncharacterized protein n=1 Tax=Dyella koreensis TaxID=311235 RepID=A0ABW8K0Z9_9GAMM